MKNGLLATSAVALALTMGSAKAAEWNMDVGGFFTGGVGVVSEDVSDASVKIVSDSEIHVKPSIVLDNGLTFGAKVEFEANNPTGGGNVDEYDMFVKGSFGEVRIGANDGAQDVFSGGIPCPTFSCADDGMFDRTGINSIDIDGRSSSDNIKISYFSPSFAGFRAGVSYIPSGDDEGDRISGDTDANSFEAGAAYNNTFGNISLGFGAGYFYDGNAADENNFGVSGNIGFSGFTVGASYGDNNGGDDSAFGVGATYATGPWQFGAHYASRIDATAGNDSAWNSSVGVSYKIAQGVTAGAAFEFGDADTATADDIYAGSAFLALSF